MLPFWPYSGRQGRLPFHWTTEATLHLPELSCTILSYAAPYKAMLYPIELRCALLSYAAPL